MSSSLPWPAGTTPLMLAPMRGMTNRSLRALFCARYAPDVVFTEFLRVRGAARRSLSAADRRELEQPPAGVPLVVQLIGHDPAALASAAQLAQEAGVRHLNLNLGCPYGRMSRGPTGGGLLEEAQRLPPLLAGLRRVIRGSFSVKVRAGFADPRQIFSLLPCFEEAGVDFLILHPRTVRQQYAGAADHDLTAEVVAQTRLPVIANGDIRQGAQGRALLQRSGAAGLMLGRGAVADPLLFARLRGAAPDAPPPAARVRELRDYLQGLLAGYRELFCGPAQILAKLKEPLAFIDEPWLQGGIRRLRRATTLEAFAAAIEELSS